MSSNVYIYKGLPGSGKTTKARAFQEDHPGTKRVNKDDLRAMLDNGVWSKKNEPFVLKVRDAIIRLSLEEGTDCIVDDTNLHPKHAEHIQHLVETFMHEMVGTVCACITVDCTDVPLEECIKRDAHRANPVGEKVIRSMQRSFLTPKVEKVVPPPQDMSLPSTIIVDLDGTLCLFGKNNPYKRDFSQDVLNDAVAFVLRSAFEQGDTVHLFSGRLDDYRKETEEWLENHAIPYHVLQMRAHDDTRKDAVVKEEMYRAHIAGKYAVRFVLDDRNAVVDLWRTTLGLRCFQVADGNF